MERGARLSGSRFAYLRGELVLLELALVRYAMRKLVGEGFEPVIPPVLVREQALYGTGFLPDTEQQIYHLPDDDLYLVGTSEVALASLHRDEILDADQLPLRYAGFSTCFRREAGAAGKDTRGIFRVHQFDKVEMFSFVEPDAAPGGARAAARDRGVDPDRARDPLPGGGDRGRRPRRLGREEVRHRGVAARAGALPRADLDARTRPTSRRGGSTSATARHDGRPVHVAHAQRDRGRGRADDHRAAGERPAGRRSVELPGAGGVRGACGPAAGRPKDRPRELAEGGARSSRTGAADCPRAGHAAVDCCSHGHARAAGGRSSSSTISAARGGPQVAILARMRTPKVFHGLTKVRVGVGLDALGRVGDRGGESGPRWRPRRRPAQQLGHRSVDRVLLGHAEQALGITGHALGRAAASRRPGTRPGRSGIASARVSSSSPSPHDEHTRPDGGGGTLPGAGAAQWPQNQLHSTVVSRPPSTSLSAGLGIEIAFSIIPAPAAHPKDRSSKD